MNLYCFKTAEPRPECVVKGSWQVIGFDAYKDLHVVNAYFGSSEELQQAWPTARNIIKVSTAAKYQWRNGNATCP